MDSLRSLNDSTSADKEVSAKTSTASIPTNEHHVESPSPSPKLSEKIKGVGNGKRLKASNVICYPPSPLRINVQYSQLEHKGS